MGGRRRTLSLAGCGSQVRIGRGTGIEIISPAELGASSVDKPHPRVGDRPTRLVMPRAHTSLSRRENRSQVHVASEAAGAI